jgi:hypothetical protein
MKFIWIKDGKNTLVLPDSFGHTNVKLNGNKIPSAKIWDFVARYLARGDRVPQDQLLTVAMESEMFRWEPTTMLVYTLKPWPDDRPTDTTNIYWRTDRQRVRPLVDEFDVRIARIYDTGSLEVAVRTLHEFAAKRGWYPVGMNDNRVYYTSDPQSVFDAFGTKDWVRIGVYLKRPGGSSVEVSFV